jgi:hypothetical protein
MKTNRLWIWILAGICCVAVHARAEVDEKRVEEEKKKAEEEAPVWRCTFMNHEGRTFEKKGKDIDSARYATRQECERWSKRCTVLSCAQDAKKDD